MEEGGKNKHLVRCSNNKLQFGCINKNKTKASHERRRYSTHIQGTFEDSEESIFLFFFVCEIIRG